MTNREKVIIVFALLAVVYGVYIVFLEPKAQQATFTTSEKELDSLNTFITKVAVATKEGLSEKDSYILQRAENQWLRDPLIRIRKPKISAEEESQKSRQSSGPETAILYTGYLEMGTMRLAIINGNEYAAGDRLEQGGYVVRSISPNQIVIAATDGSKNLFIVPLQETQ